jgi:hypothetical protein
MGTPELVEARIGLLDRVVTPHLHLVRSFRIGRDHALTLAERRGEKSFLFETNTDGRVVFPMSIDDVKAACKALSASDPEMTGLPQILWSFFEHNGTATIISDELDIGIDPSKPGQFFLIFRGPEGRCRVDLNESEARAFVAAANAMT